MSQAAVYDLLEQIHKLRPEDRLLLEDLLAREQEIEWRREAVHARTIAKAKGIDQAAIDRAVHTLRQGG